MFKKFNDEQLKSFEIEPCDENELEQRSLSVHSVFSEKFNEQSSSLLFNEKKRTFSVTTISSNDVEQKENLRSNESPKKKITKCDDEKPSEEKTFVDHSFLQIQIVSRPNDT